MAIRMELKRKKLGLVDVDLAKLVKGGGNGDGIEPPKKKKRNCKGWV